MRCQCVERLILSTDNPPFDKSFLREGNNEHVSVHSSRLMTVILWQLSGCMIIMCSLLKPFLTPAIVFLSEWSPGSIDAFFSFFFLGGGTKL